MNHSEACAPDPISKTEPWDARELALCLAVTSIVFFADKCEKWLIRQECEWMCVGRVPFCAGA